MISFFQDGPANEGKTTPPTSLAISPEYEQLRACVGSLQLELSELFVERDNLILHVCKKIEADYMLKIGVWEFKIFEFECKILRLKRKIELVQKQLNRQQKISIPDIETILDEEYAEYDKKLREKTVEIDKTLKLQDAPVLSGKENSELKKLYRQIVKAAHPDLNPDASEHKQGLLLRATTAYKNANLEELRIIMLLLTDISAEDTTLGTLEELAEKKEKLLSQKKKFLEHIEKIKGAFPYNQVNFLKDKEQVAKRVKELQEKLNEYKEIYPTLEKYLIEILRTGGQA